MQASNLPRKYFVAWGPVRGSCGHRHRSIRAACKCADRDNRACKALGGGSYSDRQVRGLSALGEIVSMTLDEHRTVDAWFDEAWFGL